MMPPLSTFDPMAPLPPSTLLGGSGVPGPPAVEFRPLPGNPAYGVPFINGEAQKQFLPLPPNPGNQPPTLSATELGQINAAGFEPTQVGGQSFDAKGVPYLTKKGGVKAPETRTFKRGLEEVTMQWNPERNGWEPVKFLDENGDGIDDRQQKGGAGAPAPTASETTTSSGVKVKVTTPSQAAVQTGQMPNEAFASPLSPEQSLEAARQEYMRTGDDSALKEHFKQFPSKAAQLFQKEAQVWNNIGQQSGQMSSDATERGQQIEDRNAYIDRFSGSPFTQGAIAAEYAANFPEAMTQLNGAPMRPDFQLLAEADRLNREAQQAAGRPLPPPMRPVMPTPPVLPLTQASRNPGGIMDRLSRMPIPTQKLKVKPRNS